MKKYFIALIIITVVTAGCSKKGKIDFCENVDREGKGISCGTVFTTGDISILINAKDNFGTDTIVLKVYNTAETNNKSVLTRDVKVDPAVRSTYAEIPMYDEGVFRIVAEVKGNIVAEGSVELADSIGK